MRTIPSTSKLTVVMYHYVRDLARSRYPNIKGLTTSEFKFQINYLKHNFTLVSIEQIIASIDNHVPLPKDAALLTFDDGYLDHFLTTFPVLDELGIPAAFFPPVATTLHGELLDVNRIHFILANCTNPSILVDAIGSFISKPNQRADLLDPKKYWEQFGKPNRFDSAEVCFVKQMLQYGLPEQIRRDIARTLFADFVGVDEKVMAAELYMNIEQLKLMRRRGFHIGVHGDRHLWLEHLDSDEQSMEIEQSLRMLDEIGRKPDEPWSISYPYGSWNQSLLNILRDRGCSLGFTVEPRVANLATDDSLLIPRLDTNDLPRQSESR